MPRPREPVIARRGAIGTSPRAVRAGRRVRGPQHARRAPRRHQEAAGPRNPAQASQFQRRQDLVSWLGTFTLERVLGTVPVEEDGSAAVRSPGGPAVFFVALDEKDLSVKRMHSFTSVMPGETLACVGCHERRTARRSRRHADLAALHRPPSRIEPFAASRTCWTFPATSSPFSTDVASSAITPNGATAACRWPAISARSGRRVFSVSSPTGKWPMGERAGRFPTAKHRQLGQPVAEEARPQPLRREGHAPRVAHGLAVDRKRAPTPAPMPDCAVARDQEKSLAAVAAVFKDGADVLRARCGQCHALGEKADEQGRPLPLIRTATIAAAWGGRRGPLSA